MKNLLGWLTVGAWCLVAPMARGAEPKVETVVGGLITPCGVAVQPETGHVFVADSGAGRIVRIVEGKIEDVVVGSPLDVYGKGPMYNIGPLGLVFLDKNTLAVGDGGYKDGSEYIRLFDVPAVGKPALKYDDAKTKLGPLAEMGDIKGEGNLYGLAASKNAIYVTCNGDDTKGWVSKADIVNGKPGELKRFIATKEAVMVDAPVGITISARGEIVVGQMGEINVPQDALLSFYNASTGKLLMNQKTGLYDITSVAYSPKTQQLYALDFAWMKTEEGGLFQLVAERKEGQAALTTKKIAGLDKPTAMAFTADGTAYVTIVGTAKDGEEKPGKLVKISGL